MARGDQLARQWKIIQSLISSRRGRSASDLAQDLHSQLLLSCMTRLAHRLAGQARSCASRSQAKQRTNGRGLPDRSRPGGPEETGRVVLSVSPMPWDRSLSLTAWRHSRFRAPPVFMYSKLICGWMKNGLLRFNRQVKKLAYSWFLEDKLVFYYLLYQIVANKYSNIF